MWIFTKTINSFLTLFFPPLCLVCKRESSPLCIECTKKCRRSVETPYKWIYVTYSYKDHTVKKCIQLLKYYHRKDLIHPLVTGTYNRELFDFIGEKSETILVPIPSPRRRILLRGYNHALLVAKAYSELLGIPVSKNILIRERYTKQQAKTKHRTDRIKNIAHAFTVNIPTHFIITQRIILIDDTTTTGATLSEAKKVLEKAGFKNIQAITLAH